MTRMIEYWNTKFLKVDTLKLYTIICEHQQYNFQSHNI